MTILFVTHYAGFYGANKSLYTLMLLLRERYGVQPVVLLPFDGPMCTQLERAGIPFKVSHYYWWVNYNHGFFQWLLNKRKQIINYFHIPRLCRLFSESHPALIYTNSMCVNVGILMAEYLGVPHIWQYREAYQHLGFKLSLSKTFSRKMWANNTTRVHILISDYLVDYYRSFLPNERMVRIYNGVDLPEGTLYRQINIIDGRMKIACVGVLSEQKNQMELLKAQALLRNRGVEVETYFYGTCKEEYIAQMQQYVLDNHLENIAHIAGHTNDVFGALQEMNLGVVCARNEAFGRTTIEFMLMHMPVVASDSGANPELINAGKTGEIYPLGNVRKLADAIENYVRHPEQLQKQGLEAARVAKRNFSAERNAELIYEQICNAIKS